MSLVNPDLCIVCSKIVKKCHKDIRCKICNSFIHTKCTKMKPKQLKSVNKKDWVCEKCRDDTHIDSNCDIETDLNDLNEASEFNVTDVDFQ